MKRFALLFLACLLGLRPGFCQTPCPPLGEWQRFLGGNREDYATSIRQTQDGGFIVGGTSASEPGGSKASPNFGSNDFWVIRLDSKGRKMWDKSFGGSDDDSLAALRMTADGGFILGGSSTSQPSGNKTSVNFGGNDFWVVRLNAAGEKLWEQSFGGSGDDYLSDLQQTEDGGFIVGGGSSSVPSGNKTSPRVGFFDFWIIRLAADGTKLWESTYGDTYSSSLKSLQQTADGGYILGGSRITALTNGNLLDYRVVRVNSDGLTLWDRSYGGGGFDFLLKLRQTQDGGFVLAGESSTTASFFDARAWVVRLDGGGDKLWDWAFGGGERLGAAVDVQETRESGFIVAGESLSWTLSSYPGFEVPTPSDVDGWLARLDFQGRLLWKDSLGTTNSNEYIRSLEPTSDGGFVAAGRSDAVSFRTNAISFPGTGDFWILKLGPEDDCDHDGIPTPLDHCPDTLPGAVVDANGCRIDQLCPCDGGWKSHGEYVKHVAHVAAQFRKHRLISESEMHKLIKAASRSDCGKRRGEKEEKEEEIEDTPAEGK